MASASADRPPPRWKRKSALSKAASDVSPQKVFVAAHNGPIKPQLPPQHLLHAPTDPGMANFIRQGLADVKLGSQTKLASTPEEAGSPAIKAHMGGHEMQQQHKSGQLGGSGSGLQAPEALARTLSGHRRTSTWTPGNAALGPPGPHRRSSSGDHIDPGAIMSASAALQRTSRASGSGQLTPSRPPPPPPAVARAAAAAGGVVPQAQVRVTKNVGGDVSLISWDDPALPAKEVYSAVLTADGKHALVKTPSDVVGQSKTEVLLVSETASPSLADIILGPLKQREAQGSPQQAIALQAGATDSPLGTLSNASSWGTPTQASSLGVHGQRQHLQAPVAGSSPVFQPGPQEVAHAPPATAFSAGSLGGMYSTGGSSDRGWAAGMGAPEQERADSGPLPSADNPQQLPQRLPAFTQQQQRFSESGRSPTLVADPLNPFGECAVFT